MSEFTREVSAALSGAGIEHDLEGRRMSATEETTVSMTAGGITTKPVPLSTFTGQLAMFEGSSYPDVEIKVSGGLDGTTLDLLPEVTGQRVGDPFEIVISGEIIAKTHKIKRDADGFASRVLVVSLKVDNMRMLDDSSR